MKIQTLIRAKVVECNPATEAKDLEKGLKFVVVLESEKNVTPTLKSPEFIKAKSLIELKPGEHLLEVDVFNIAQPNSKPVTYYRITKKVEGSK